MGGPPIFVTNAVWMYSHEPLGLKWRLSNADWFIVVSGDQVAYLMKRVGQPAVPLNKQTP